jgi:hypothetical protein
MIEKAHILEEIKRTAEANAGKALGVERFFAETGVRRDDWRGRYWASWSDALEEAGYSANTFGSGAIPVTELLRKLAEFTRRLGHLPTRDEMMLERRRDRDFPNQSIYGRRIGDKATLVEELRKFCQAAGGFDDVVALCDDYLVERPRIERAAPPGVGAAPPEFVYLLKVGRHYKIGKTNSVGRRERELAIQLPQRGHLIHQIATDDPSGIERHWHERFSSRRGNGEWFELQPADVAAFKQRKFM